MVMLHSCPEYVLIGEKGREEPIINSTAEFDENLVQVCASLRKFVQVCASLHKFV